MRAIRYLDAHVLDGYKFLMENYCAGDKICMFGASIVSPELFSVLKLLSGFSRGAYTARSAVVQLFSVGRCSYRAAELWLGSCTRLDSYPRIMNHKLLSHTRCTSAPTRKDSRYVPDSSRPIAELLPSILWGFGGSPAHANITFLWNYFFMGRDTVASVGVIMGRTLPFTNSNSSIKTFRHALSLDEVRGYRLNDSVNSHVFQHRAKFRPNNYHRPSPSIQAARLDPENGSSVLHSKDDSESISGEGTAAEKKKRWGFLGKGRAGKKAGKTVVPELLALGESDDVLEIWFSGCHSGKL